MMKAVCNKRHVLLQMVGTLWSQVASILKSPGRDRNAPYVTDFGDPHAPTMTPTRAKRVSFMGQDERYRCGATQCDAQRLDTQDALLGVRSGPVRRPG